MRKRQFRYILPFLLLLLFLFATFAVSQNLNKPPTEESKSTEQPPSKQDTEESKIAEQSQSEKNTEETKTTEQTSENTISSESQSDTLKEDIKDLQFNLEELIHSSNSLYQYYVLITIILFILFSAFVILWIRRLLQKQRSIHAKSEQRLESKINHNQQNLESRLHFISQQGKGNTEKLEETASIYSTIHNELTKFQSEITEFESHFNNIDKTLEELKVDRETPIIPDNSQVDEMDAETTVLQTLERSEELELAYKNGEPIDLNNIDMTKKSHNKMWDLNWIAWTLREWKTELEQSTTENQDIIRTLKYAEHAIKEKLKTIREESMIKLKPYNLETDLGLDDLQTYSIVYPAQLKGILIGYELAREINEEEVEQYIKQFVRNDLFNNVAKHIPHDQLQEQFERFLQLADFKVIPIEVGKTEADSLYHDIQGSKQTDVKRGTVAEVITPGLLQKTDNSIVQKPVVIRGE